MVSKILLIGRANDETNNIRRELRRQEVYSVDVATTSEQAMKSVTDEAIQLLIFNTEILTRKKLGLIKELKNLGRDFPALVLANTVMADGFDELENSVGTVFLEKPFEVKDLFGLTEKLVHRRMVKQRFFRRFPTNQEGKLLKTPADIPTLIRIRNLSQGGAYFEYEGRPHFTIGDQVFVDIALSQVKKEYKMKAKVVWTSPTSAFGRNGLGVEFVR